MWGLIEVSYSNVGFVWPLAGFIRLVCVIFLDTIRMFGANPQGTKSPELTVKGITPRKSKIRLVDPLEP